VKKHANKAAGDQSGGVCGAKEADREKVLQQEYDRDSEHGRITTSFGATRGSSKIASPFDSM